MIRVFARKTNLCPDDDLAFFDEPPLFRLPDMPVRVSVTFTWDIERGKRLTDSWAKHFDDVQIGGPAFDDAGGNFVAGRFLRKGVVITSRGCPNRCSYCLVDEREGRIRELPIVEGNIIQDNNLLACSRKHIEDVFVMLENQNNIQFKGGLDIDYLEDWHVQTFKHLSISELWVACDNKAGLKRLDKAADMLGDFSINKKRCYVLIGKDETLEEAESRCEKVYEKGFLPFAQLFQPVQWIKYSKEWRDLARRWSRPAIYRAAPMTAPK